MNGPLPMSSRGLGRRVVLLVLGVCGAQAAQPAAEADAARGVTLAGQRRFMDASIALCIERVPALKVELEDARARAELQIAKAEALIREQIAATARRDRPLLDRFISLWNSTASDLLEALKKQRADTACPTLRDNWVAMQADVIVEDWQNYLDRNLAEDEARWQRQ